MEIEKKETEISTNIEVYENIISPITLSHIDVCNCQGKRLLELKKEFFQKELQDLKEEDLYNDITVRESRLRRSQELAREYLIKECREKNIRCPVEQKIVEKDISLFKQKYDLSDPRAHIIVENVLSLKLSAHRLALHVTHNDPVQSVIDKEGNETFKLNPAEKAKMDYNNSMIQAIKELNLIFEGSKNVNINIDLENIPNAIDIWGKDKTIVGEFKEID